MSAGDKKTFEVILGIAVGLLAIYSIRSIFENDNSRIVSKKGKKLLSDKNKMKDISERIARQKDTGDHKEIIIE